MKQPFLSIIIPVYNAESTVEKIVSSILSENIDDIELILVDDGSTDTTLKVLRGIKSNRKDIVVVSQKNSGPSAARNSGIKKAKGEYIQFYDADDDIVSGSIKKLIGVLRKDTPDVLVSGWIIDLERNGKLVSGYKTVQPKEYTVKAPNIIKYVVESIGTDGKLYNLWNKVFRADIIRDNNLLFREDLRFGEDLIFALEYFKYAQKMMIIPDVTYRYKSSNSTGVFSKSSLVPEYRRINNEALEKFVGEKRDKELDDLYNWVKWRWLLSYWMIVAASNLPVREKIKLIREFSTSNFIVAKRHAVIGFKKFITEHIANVLRRAPRLALVASRFVVFIKNTIVRVKSLFKN
jgi:glycosyltransferase involved in cell wall biosynthesis